MYQFTNQLTESLSCTQSTANVGIPMETNLLLALHGLEMQISLLAYFLRYKNTCTQIFWHKTFNHVVHSSQLYIIMQIKPELIYISQSEMSYKRYVNGWT